MTVKFKFKNGQEVKCVVSGFTGIIDCSSIWLNGCVRYSLQPKVEIGKSVKPDSVWMDEEQLVLISEGVLKKVKPSKHGGPSFVNNSNNR